MKICVWVAAVGLLAGAASEAGDGAGASRRTAVSVFSAENLSAETTLASTLSAPWPGPSHAASGWQQFRHGSLWADYCLQHTGCAAVSPVAESYPEKDHAGWFRVPLSWRNSLRKPCRSCGQQRVSAWDRLCGLLGWERRTSYRMVCPERLDRREPVENVYFDDPAPLPPTVPARVDPNASRGETNAESDLKASDTPPAKPDTLREDMHEPDDASGELELTPAPTDDPAPAPQPEIPRNKLPKPPPASPESSRVTSGRSVLANRLSDYIKTR